MAVRLIYCSRAVRDMQATDLDVILAAARRRNAALGVCGMLAYARGWFLQALEGARAVINPLYLDIAADPRHRAPEIIAYDYVEQALFEPWPLGHAVADHQLGRLLYEFGLDSFEPARMTPLQALRVLDGLSGRRAVVAA